MDMTPFPYRHQLLSVRGNSYLHSQREFTMSFDMNSFSFFNIWDTCPPTLTQSRRDKIYTHIFCSGGRSSLSSDTATNSIMENIILQQEIKGFIALAEGLITSLHHENYTKRESNFTRGFIRSLIASIFVEGLLPNLAGFFYVDGL